MHYRSVRLTLYAHPYDMGGIPIRQPFPTAQVDQLDPFLLLHHANINVPEHVAPDNAGVGPHPHRGFSPVTFIFEGGVHHRDSRGNNSTVYAGGAQWMNAGRGIIHSERPPHDIHQRGGRQEIIQLWINTPSQHKMDQPAYFPLQAEDIPVYISPDKLVTAGVVAGKLGAVQGKVPTMTPVQAITLTFRPGGKIEIPIPLEHQAFVYILRGSLRMAGYGLAEAHHALVFNPDGEAVAFEAVEETTALFMSGEPIGEKVVAHGPFVMNTETEILEAMRDYQQGRMGVLIEE